MEAGGWTDGRDNSLDIRVLVRYSKLDLLETRRFGAVTIFSRLEEPANTLERDVAADNKTDLLHALNLCRNRQFEIALPELFAAMFVSTGAPIVAVG